MMPMKIRGSQVSMKLVTSSKNELPSYFGVVVTAGGCVSSGFVVPSADGGVVASPCGAACAQSLGATQCGSARAGAVTAAKAATTVARAIATRRRRSGLSTTTAVTMVLIGRGGREHYPVCSALGAPCLPGYSTSSRRLLGRYLRPTFAHGLPSTSTTSAVKSFEPLSRDEPTPYE